jgi:PAS domain S-box-containing protein
LLITDICMPQMDGVTLGQIVKERWKRVYLAFTSGHSDTDALMRAIGIGAEFFIRKPIDLSELYSVLAKVAIKKARRKDIDALQANMSIYWELMNSFMIVSTIDKNGVITYANTNFCKISGYTMSELVGKPYSIVRRLDASNNTYEEFFGTLTKEGEWRGESKNCAKDGSIYWTNAFISQLPKGSREEEFISVCYDITEAKELKHGLQLQVEKGLKENEDQNSLLERSARMSMMGEMISMIAHQWRQPLATISALTGGMRMELMLGSFDTDSLVDNLVEVDSTVQHLSSTIDDFRDFFKPDKALEKVELAKVLEKSIKMLEGFLKSKGIQVEENFNDAITIFTYERELLQVFINIIKNSIDVLEEQKIKDPTITITMSKIGEHASIVVADNGGGIPAYLLPDKLFDPYISTKGNVGTGIGLYMSRIIVEIHCGGFLKAGNSDVGAEFTVMLPLLPRQYEISNTQKPQGELNVG